MSEIIKYEHPDPEWQRDEKDEFLPLLDPFEEGYGESALCWRRQERSGTNAVEGEILPPETPREWPGNDPLYHFASFTEIPAEAFEYLNIARKQMLRVTGLPLPSEAKEGTIVDRLPPTRTWNASPLMRRMGYIRNQDTCIHERKTYSPSSGWSCRDCGEPNLVQKSRLTL